MNLISDILNKKLGTFVPVLNRTKLFQEFTGLTVRNWLMFPVRSVILLPLLIVIKVLNYVTTFLDFCFDTVDSFVR